MPIFPQDTTQQVACGSDSTFFSVSIGTEWYRLYVDSVKNKFDSDYTARCLKAVNAETFTVTHKQSEYHYTLYYYDQAGNLLKTVPPAGVNGQWRQGWYDSVAAARKNSDTLPVHHALVTQYRYNSLNQVVSQQTPDAGKSSFWYSAIGSMYVKVKLLLLSVACSYGLDIGARLLRIFVNGR